MIIIEGPDGAGKTTFARKVCALGGLEYHKMGPPEPGMDHVDWYGERLLLGRDQLWDRFHLGEEAYGYFGFSKRGTWTERETVRLLVRQHRALVVIVWASRQDALKLDAEKQLYDPVQVNAVRQRYGEIVTLHPDWWHAHYDVAVKYPSEDDARTVLAMHADMRQGAKA